MIFTFYSYKGGVGRSMALANVARWLADQGLHVVMVDWDLEAPGLESFFTEGERTEDAQARPGLIDLLLHYRDRFVALDRAAQAMAHEAHPDGPGTATAAVEREAQLAFERVLSDALVPVATQLLELPTDGKGRLRLLTAGYRGPDRFEAYAEAVQDFDWSELYTAYRGAEFFEWMRRQLLGDAVGADVVLIDSRTGVTEMGGVCTRQLADVVVSFAGANFQNLDGVVRMIESFTRPEIAEFRARVQGLDEPQPPQVVAVPTRVDEQGETGLLLWFEREFRKKLDRFTPAAFADVRVDFWSLLVPYVVKYAFRETLVIGDKEPNPKLAEAFRRLARHLLILVPETAPALAKLAPATREAVAALRGGRDVRVVAESSPKEVVERARRFMTSLRPVEQEMAELMLVRLSDARGAPLDALGARTEDPGAFDALVRRMAGEELIVEGAPWPGEPEVVYHLDQTLSGSWERLDELRAAEADFLAFVERLRSKLSLDEPLLRCEWAQAEVWLERRGGALTGREIDLIVTSRWTRRVTRDDRPRAMLRRNRRRRPILGWLLTLSLLWLSVGLLLAAASIGVPVVYLGIAVVYLGLAAFASLGWASVDASVELSAAERESLGLDDLRPRHGRLQRLFTTERRGRYVRCAESDTTAYYAIAPTDRKTSLYIPALVRIDVLVQLDGAQLRVEGPRSRVRRMLRPIDTPVRYQRVRVSDEEIEAGRDATPRSRS